MARARVELKGCQSYNDKARKFKKGEVQIITNPTDILFFKSLSDFSVTELQEIAPKVKKAKKKPVPEKIVPKEVAPKEEVLEDDDGETEDDIVYTKDELKEMKKRELVELATQRDLFLEGTERKSRIINVILDGQGEKE